ncbi:uncharacterized protein BP5553_00467 [Venustampulla echinocandica]|uniref:G protein gamma domain-containing protein n=1 Tax=Venustampulla echinocandica TaxID=2656787 RepID=A0A370TYA9_9HELO|nr:uncharacterized protein BP5553_00467 [Venustampulla echinocandica]RDL40488.1 hypothetical protein BP5553_00467 [Venustampulla echinocandica]
MPSYSSRDMGDPSQIRKNKQSMADLKLRRLTELNNRLREDLERERIPVSQAAARYVRFGNIYRASSAAQHSTVILIHPPIAASSPTPTARKTSWSHPSGAPSTRRTTPMRRNKVEGAAP